MKSRWIKISVAILFFLFQPIVFAAAIFNITTTDQTVNVEPGGTATFTYTVQNTSGINMTGMKYYPPAGTTRTGGTCGSTLANGASCTVQLSFHAPSTPGTILLGPMKVCGHNGQICSQSNAANQVRVIVGPSPAGTLTITINPSDSLQYQSLHVVNNSTLNAQITSVTVAPALSGFVKWCQSGDGTCFQQSTCPIGMDIPPAPAPGSSCDLWFQSLDGSNIPIGPQSGALEVDTNDGMQHNFTADYEMDLYVGGTFTTAGGVTVNRVARWDGTAWSDLSGPSGTGANSSVRKFAVYNGDLYAGGDFTTAGGVTVNRIARWDGTAWSDLSGPSGTGMNSGVRSLAVYKGDLYAGGLFATAGGVTVNSVARWDGTAWSDLSGPSGTGANGSVTSLVVLNDDLYAGGAFTTAGGVTVNRVARWDETEWSDLSGPSGTGMDGTVQTLTTLNTDLYAGGLFTTAGGVTVNRVARWDTVGLAWSALSGPSGTGTDATVETLTTLNGDLYAGGSFTTAGGVTVNRVARWDTVGLAWSALSGSGTGTDAVVSALVEQNGDLYVGGLFTTAGGTPANGVARWDTTNWFALASGVSPASVLGLLPASSLTLN